MKILAHAFGARFDLPIPLWIFVVSGAFIVVVSFLLVLPRRFAPAAEEHERVQDGAHLRPTPWWPGALSVLFLAFLCWCGFVGSQDVPENILPTTFWLLIWIAVPLSVALVGDWTQPVNPFFVLSRVADSAAARRAILGGEEPLRWPAWLGWWPAVVLFFLAVLGELVFNVTVAQVPQNTALALALYAVLSLLGGFFFGESWRIRGEFWTVLYDTWGRIGYFRFGAPGRRGFAGGLERPFSSRASRVVFVLLMLLNVNYDGLLTTPQWANDVQRRLPGDWGLPGTHLELFQTATFIAMVAVMFGLFGGFAHESAVVGRHRTRFLGSLSGLLPSVVPIAFGYLFAHNIEFILVNSQLMAPLIGNPPGLHSWPIHLPYPFNDSYEVNHTFLPSSFYWYTAVVVIIAVHVIAVVIAHRHIQRRSDPDRERAAELPWLAAMVGYTMLSLWLLAQPLIKETASTSGAPTPTPPSVSTPVTMALATSFDRDHGVLTSTTP